MKKPAFPDPATPADRRRCKAFSELQRDGLVERYDSSRRGGHINPENTLVVAMTGHSVMHSTEQCADGASNATIEDVCEACGTLLTAPTPAAPPPSRKDASRKVSAPRQRRPRKTPTMLRLKKMRASVKVDMLAVIPGLSHAKAAAVLEACEGSFARLVGMSSTQLGRAACGGTPIGTELGVAIFRALH